MGLAQAGVAGLELVGARRDDVFQFVEVIGQAVLGIAPLLDLGGHADELLVGNLDQHADLVVFVTGRERQLGLRRIARVAVAQGADHPHQRLGQHDVEQTQENAGKDQAAHETVEQGDLGTLEKAAAEGEGVDFQEQRAEVIIGHVAEKQPVLEFTIVAEQKIAHQAITAFLARALHVGEYCLVIVDQPGAGDGR
ncbi:hypothetical protein D9M71_587500 [compost metagenome]